MIYNCKISNINEIPILLKYLYNIGFRLFNGTYDIKIAKKFYIDRFNNKLCGGLYITWSIKNNNIASSSGDEINPNIGFNYSPFTGYNGDEPNRLFNIQKIMREKKLNRILK